MKRNKNKIYHEILSSILNNVAWIQYGRQYQSPVRHDRIIRISPKAITHKPIKKPPTNIYPKELIVKGDWDKELKRIDEDIVFKSFYKRFVENLDWEATGYWDFLMTDISEHGNKSPKKALKRCNKIDKLYENMMEDGYKSQKEIDQTGDPIKNQPWKWLPPEYREISVNVSREGEFLWQTGMHRLVIAKLLQINRIPVRINARHERWQQIRENTYRNYNCKQNLNHPDLRYLRDS